MANVDGTVVSMVSTVSTSMDLRCWGGAPSSLEDDSYDGYDGYDGFGVSSAFFVR